MGFGTRSGFLLRAAWYVTWVKGVGERIKVGEVYANIYEPWSWNIEHLTA